MKKIKILKDIFYVKKYKKFFKTKEDDHEK